MPLDVILTGWSEWSAWGSCHVTCSGGDARAIGTKQRTRECLQTNSDHTVDHVIARFCNSSFSDGSLLAIDTTRCLVDCESKVA